MPALGALLRQQREQAQLTQEELAHRAQLSARTVSDIERGLRSRIYTDTAERLATALALTDRARSTFLAVARGRVPRESLLPATLLPRPLTPLLGREGELAALTDALLGRSRRLVTVTGLGGIGKTRLALAAAGQLEGSYAGGVRFAPIAPNQDPDLLVGMVAQSVGASDRTGPGALAMYLAGHPTLVVLDAFEHVLTAAPQLEDLLLTVPELSVLVTSRVRLRITGEHEVALVPLDLPDASDPRWYEAPAAALFLERARDLQPDLDADAELIVDICRRVSGLPLALELTAARVRHLPLAALRTRLPWGLTDLTRSEPDRVDRDRSMEDVLVWTVSSLTEDEALVMRVTALFAGGWRLDAAQSLCGDQVDVVRAVGGLVDNSLVCLDRSPIGNDDVPRWRMLDVVREFVLGQHPDEIDRGLRTAYQEFFLDLLARVAANVGPEQTWFQVLDAEEANVRTALRWAAEDHDAETLLRLGTGMWQYWQARGELTEGRRWLEIGLSLGAPATDETRMTALWGIAWLAYHQADDDAAEVAATELEQLAFRHGDEAAHRNAATIRGMLAISRDDSALAVRLLEKALDIARRLGRDWILATSLLNLGLGYLSGGATDRARAVLAEALAMYEQLGDERFHARCLGYLGLASLLEDDSQRARALFGQSLRAFHGLREPGGTAEGLAGLAAVHAANDQLALAATLAAAGERLRESFAGRELPLDRRTIGHYLAAARAQLGTEAWAEAWRRGWDLALDDAVELGLWWAPWDSNPQPTD
jgi:predicted ATPase/DNA-binding XRE family transcriptional regulator